MKRKLNCLMIFFLKTQNFLFYFSLDYRFKSTLIYYFYTTLISLKFEMMISSSSHSQSATFFLLEKERSSIPISIVRGLEWSERRGSSILCSGISSERLRRLVLDLGTLVSSNSASGYSMSLTALFQNGFCQL